MARSFYYREERTHRKNVEKCQANLHSARILESKFKVFFLSQVLILKLFCYILTV